MAAIAATTPENTQASRDQSSVTPMPTTKATMPTAEVVARIRTVAWMIPTMAATRATTSARVLTASP